MHLVLRLISDGFLLIVAWVVGMNPLKRPFESLLQEDEAGGINSRRGSVRISPPEGSANLPKQLRYYIRSGE